jgi:hypothetical protein
VSGGRRLGGDQEPDTGASGPRSGKRTVRDVVHAMIFPTATIVNVIAVQIAGLVIATGAG